ncbi:MAG TPA: cyclic nucleotide-binding domain-containing protein [Kofleriaceae bacterium]|nr:cyclic nucleotide-binding domain-containing protein [Kofleriaceae bacterium]
MNRRAFVLGAAMVLLGNLVAIALRSFAEAAFLEAYGKAQVPWLFVASAAGFAIATLGYDWVTTRMRSVFAVDLGLLAALGIAAATAPAMLSAGVTPVVLVVALTALSQVAGLALWNRVAASTAGRDARRMLPLAGACATAGGAIAGLGAGALIPRFGMSIAPAIAAGATVVVIALCLGQQRALTRGGAPGATAPAGSVERLGELHRALLRGLAIVALLEATIATVVDLQFADALKARYTGNDLALALSLFYGGTNAILLVLQATAVPRLLVTRSVPTTAAIHPLVVIGWYLGFAIAPTFVAVAGTRTADQVLRLATSRTSQEIELSPLPVGPRARWKVLLRGAVWPAGAAAAALALLAIGPGALASPTTLAATTIAIAFIWWIASQLAARRFQAALAAPLGIRTATRDDPRRIDLELLEAWTRTSGDPDARTAALARTALGRARVDASDLADHLRDDDPTVRAAMFEQFARAPIAALRGELRAAIAIEDDDRALALGIKALALAGDDSGVERGRGRADLSREVADAVRAADAMLSGKDVEREIATACDVDPAWAAALVRARGAKEPRVTASDDDYARALADAAGQATSRAGALFAIARVGRPLDVLAVALEAGEPEAVSAIAGLDVAGAAVLAREVTGLSTMARLVIARALAGATTGAPIVAQLIGDRDPEVAHAALRTALAIARGGELLPGEPIAKAHAQALAALVAHLDTRDAAGSWSACARHELDIATRRCVARLSWASAVEAAAAGRDPAPFAAAARHLTGTRDADRKRALDVLQELLGGRGEILAVIERWLRPAEPARTTASLADHDAWLARLGAGELVAIEPTLVDLRRPTLFASVAGPALAALATAATRRAVDGTLFSQGDVGDTMFVVTRGELVAQRPDGERTIEAGGVLGELAVLTHAPRAATVVSAGGEVLVIDRATFSVASRRAPELVWGLAATLAGWLAPNRPDVL